MTLLPESTDSSKSHVPFTGAMMKGEAGSSSAFQEEEETFPEDQDSQEE